MNDSPRDPSLTSFPWLDISHRFIEVGYYVCYAALWDRSATLKYGKVTRLATRPDTYNREKSVPTIRVRSVDRNWDNRWQLQSNGKEVTLAYLDRVLVVEARFLPPGVQELLDG